MNHFAQVHPILFGVFLSLGCILTGGGLAGIIVFTVDHVKKFRHYRERANDLYDDREIWRERYFNLRAMYQRDVQRRYQEPVEEFAPPALVEPVPFEVQPELPF